MATRAEVLKQIRGSELYKALHHPTNEIDRGPIEGGINSTGQATDRLMALQGRVKAATMNNADYPKELMRDASELRAMIQTAIVTLYADSEDGSITSADFKSFHDPLAGMVEGLLTFLRDPDIEAQIELRSMKKECAQKAFTRQLKKLFEASDFPHPASSFTLGKALSSLMTHTFIGAERRGEISVPLVRRISEMLLKLTTPDHKTTLETLREVWGWGLVEAEVSKEVIPPQLKKARDHPKDDEEGEEPEQETDVEKGLPKKIDKQPLEPDPKTGKKKLVELEPGEKLHEWHASVSGQQVGLVKRERHLRRVGGRLRRVMEFDVNLSADALRELFGLEKAPELETVTARSLPEARKRILEMVKEQTQRDEVRKAGERVGINVEELRDSGVGEDRIELLVDAAERVEKGELKTLDDVEHFLKYMFDKRMIHDTFGPRLGLVKRGGQWVRER